MRDPGGRIPPQADGVKQIRHKQGCGAAGNAVCLSMIAAENRTPSRIKPGTGIFAIMWV
jgi:hypothetical protein